MQFLIFVLFWMGLKLIVREYAQQCHRVTIKYYPLGTPQHVIHIFGGELL
jgi:hypothetical protein